VSYTVLLFGLAIVLVVVAVVGFQVSQAPAEMAVWGGLGTLAGLVSACAWALVRSAVESRRRIRHCPRCDRHVARAATVCPGCGHRFAADLP
jgi:Uncharacterised protein family UPF0547